MYFVILFSFVLIIQVNGGGVYEGESCTVVDRRQGICTNIRKCQAAIDGIRRGKPPQRCSFDGSDPIVCCLEDQGAPSQAPSTIRPPVATTSKPRPPVTGYEPPTENYVELDNHRGGCEPIPVNMTSRKTGRKAWDKCIEYQEKYVYPCKAGVALSGDEARANHCGRNADELILGGIDAKMGEFPHMALLGFGSTAESAQWLCGGTIISENFILTAGHCTSTRDLGQVAYIRLATLERTEPLDPTRIYRIGRIIKHPEFKSPNKYNDIALLETATEMNLDQFALPACLPVGNSYNDSRAAAIGFGATKYRGPSANVLQKVTLTKFPTSECSQKFPAERLMQQGFQENTQMCFGDRTMSKDTCQGDSGGPLHINNKQVYCMFLVMGVTSFGRACGFVGEPGIYTRVSAYTPWIESVVWPN